MMRRRSSSSNSSVEARDSASAEEWDSGVAVGRRSSTTVSLGSPPARMVSMLPGVQASLFSSMAYVPGLALRTPCSISARVRTVNCRLSARSVRARKPKATRRLTTWWPSRSRARESMKAMMAYQGGKVESPCPFRSPRCVSEEKLFPGHARQMGPDLGNRVPEELLHLVLRHPGALDPGCPGQLPAHHLGIRHRVPGPPLLADGEVVEPFAVIGVPQRIATLADWHARPPLRT